MTDEASRRADRGSQVGATAVEHSLVVALVALVVFGSVLLFGQEVVGLFDVPCGAFVAC